MKLLYLECNMGAAGDMLCAALYELMTAEQQQEYLAAMNGLSDRIFVEALPAQTNGITGTRMNVRIDGQSEGESVEAHHAHSHTAPEKIAQTIRALDLPADVKAHAQAVYDDIAAAESHVHGVPVTQIHFHEVGDLDAVADITGVCLSLNMLKPDKIVTSPVHLGSGEVHCAHGVLPVPAPATAYLLKGVPCYTGEIRGELCTPTGAALLAHFSDEYGPMPVMIPEKTGYGIGKKEFKAANCLRAFLGEIPEEDGESAAGNSDLCHDEVIELVCNIDDMTAEEMAFAGERIMEEGALDIAFAPITMKKGRPGTQLTVLCRPADEEKTALAVLRETTSNGVRVRRCGRLLLKASVRTIETPDGEVRIKSAQGFGIRHEKPEYEDAARISRQKGLSIRDVMRDLQKL